MSYIPVKLLGLRKWSGAGLVGTLEGLVLLPLVPQARIHQAAFLAAACVAAAKICAAAERHSGVHDDPRIVLDEIVGYWVAVAFLPRTWAVLALGFVLFRVLDAVKLPPYRWLDRLPGGWGIVADDVGAAVIANMAVRWALPRWPALGL